MGIKHQAVKASGDTGLASEWNANHIIDGDVDFKQYESLQHTIENRTDYPATPVTGQIIFRTDTGTLEVWDGAAWASYTGIDTSLFVKHDGTVAMTGNLDLNSKKIINLAEPVVDSDAATKNYVDTTEIGAPSTCSFVTVGAEAALSAERVLTAGEGIDLVDAGADTTITINGEDATTTNKGIASFNTNNFSVTAGAVSIKSGGVTKTEIGTDQVNDTHIDWGNGANQVSLDDVPDGTSYGRVAAGELSSGIYKNATTATKGIASFNTDDFSVSSGAVSLKDKEVVKYWSCPGSHFLPKYPDVDDIQRWEGKVQPDTTNLTFIAEVIGIPDGATITKAVVYCDNTDKTWELRFGDLDAVSYGTMASENMNSESSSITLALVKQSTRKYWFETGTMGSGSSNIIKGARIEYTITE